MDENMMPDILKKFVTDIDTIKGRSKKTVDAYLSDLQTFFRFIKVIKKICPEPVGFNSTDSDESISALKKISIDDVTIDLIKQISLDDIYSFMTYTNRVRENKAASRARKSSCLRVFFKFLYSKLKLIDMNPAELLESPKLGKTLPVYLDLESSRTLLNVARVSDSDKRDYTILTLLLNCGMRLSELVGINVQDISKEGTITITGKGNKQRVVYLNKACLSALNSYLPLRKALETNDNALFLNKNHKRLSGRGVENIVKKYLKLAGLDSTKYSAHKLRHTAATLMYQHGNVDVLALKEILGHEKLSTTQIYTHLDEKRLKDAVNANPLADEI
ncbi:MAG: tyrosine recombinase XerC [Clostridiales bacterium]|jgi:site-specific recombinase XerD|nr:tyrosine recombinase XerC [Clostridiales bacterium]